VTFADLFLYPFYKFWQFFNIIEMMLYTLFKLQANSFTLYKVSWLSTVKSERGLSRV